MKLIIGVFLVFSLNSYSDHFCYAQKSVSKFNHETGELEVEVAKTKEYLVVKEEHQDDFTLDFMKESGEKWGAVTLSTWTHVVDGRSLIGSTASILDENRFNLAYLHLSAEDTVPYVTAITMMKSDGFPPMIKIACERR